MFAHQPHQAEAVQRDRERQRGRRLEEMRRHLSLRHRTQRQRQWQADIRPAGRTSLTAFARALSRLGWQAGCHAEARVLVEASK